MLKCRDKEEEMAQSKGQDSYWSDFKKFYTALYDSEMDRADVSGDGKAWDEAERKKKEVQRIAQMGELRDRVFNPQEIKLAESRLGVNPVQMASGPPRGYTKPMSREKEDWSTKGTTTQPQEESAITRMRNQVMEGFRKLNKGYYEGKVPEEYK